MSEAMTLWKQVKENRSKLRACERHLIDVPTSPVRLGQRVTCVRCGGNMGLAELGYYIQGYEAAGKSANDIWPGYSL